MRARGIVDPSSYGVKQRISADLDDVIRVFDPKTGQMKEFTPLEVEDLDSQVTRSEQQGDTVDQVLDYCTVLRENKSLTHHTFRHQKQQKPAES